MSWGRVPPIRTVESGKGRRDDLVTGIWLTITFGFVWMLVGGFLVLLVWIGWPQTGEWIAGHWRPLLVIDLLGWIVGLFSFGIYVRNSIIDPELDTINVPIERTVPLTPLVGGIMAGWKAVTTVIAFFDKQKEVRVTQRGEKDETEEPKLAGL